MILNVNGEDLDVKVTGSIIEQKLKSLTNEGESFLILSKSFLTYMQTNGSFKDGFVLEYQIDNTDQHYKCITEPLTNEQVVKAFKNYLAGNDKWKTDLIWEKEIIPNDNENNYESSTSYTVILALIGAAIVWYLIKSA